MKLFAPVLVFFALLLAGCAPPAARPACNCSMTSIIFFDPGSATLSSKNLAAVRQDVGFFGRQVPHPILIAGGADTAEAVANPGVSLARAEAVANELEGDGIPAADVIVRDNGTQQPMLPSGPNVSQVMNRYVMVRIQLDPVSGATAVPVAAGPYQMRSVVLYQPNAMLVARLGPGGPMQLANYIGRINAGLSGVFAKAAVQPGLTAALVVGVKPGGAVRSWIVARPDTIDPALAAQIQAAAAAATPIAVQNGPLVFAIVFNAWGGGAPITDAQHPVPMPPEWTQGASGPELVPDGVFARIWP